MSTSTIKILACYAALLLLWGSGAAQAATLYVHCGASEGLNSIGAALRALKSSENVGPNTINVTGTCNENVVIQSLDRLTLNAVNNASVSDVSGGKQDVISIFDSRDVAINGFTINAGSDGVSGANGISCNDFSTCRLSMNAIQGAGSGAGFAVFQQAQATLDGDTLQNNSVGLIVNSGSKVRSGGQGRPFTSRHNGQGIHTGRQGFVLVLANVSDNSDRGVVVLFHSTLELSGSISGNGSAGAHVFGGSNARFINATITNNGGPGVLIQDLSMVVFGGATVTANGGGIDVVCSPQFSATRGAFSDTGGGTTNCVEP